MSILDSFEMSAPQGADTEDLYVKAVRKGRRRHIAGVVDAALEKLGHHLINDCRIEQRTVSRNADYNIGVLGSRRHVVPLENVVLTTAVHPVSELLHV